jgi:hypothetical protein
MHASSGHLHPTAGSINSGKKKEGALCTFIPSLTGLPPLKRQEHETTNTWYMMSVLVVLVELVKSTVLHEPEPWE